MKKKKSLVCEPNNENKTFLVFIFLVLLLFLICQGFNKKLIPTRNSTAQKMKFSIKDFFILCVQCSTQEFTTCFMLYKSLLEDEKTVLYVKLHQTRCLYFPLLFSSSA